eukprot:scaffold15833_cov54-Phaeocystis_antarctica.AAC.2
MMGSRCALPGTRRVCARGHRHPSNANPFPNPRPSPALALTLTLTLNLTRQPYRHPYRHPFRVGPLAPMLTPFGCSPWGHQA